MSLNAELLPQPDVLLVEVADLLHGEDGEQAGEQHQDDAAVQRSISKISLSCLWEDFPVYIYIIGLFGVTCVLLLAPQSGALTRGASSPTYRF